MGRAGRNVKSSSVMPLALTRQTAGNNKAFGGATQPVDDKRWGRPELMGTEETRRGSGEKQRRTKELDHAL